MFGVDRFDQNNNYLRISVGGKKWNWPGQRYQNEAKPNFFKRYFFAIETKRTGLVQNFSILK
jgi:hypothetical protein